MLVSQKFSQEKSMMDLNMITAFLVLTQFFLQVFMVASLIKTKQGDFNGDGLQDAVIFGELIFGV